MNCLTPIISVVMSTYNETEQELRQAIDSILNQTLRNFEFIIINDNPSNTLLNCVLTHYKQLDGRIVVLRNEKNLGLVASLNKGIMVAKGEYLARMDADDISDLHRLERELHFLQEHDLDVVSSLKKDINERGEIICEHYRPVLLDDAMKKLLPISTLIVHSSVLIKTELIRKMSGYRDLKAIEDYDLWLRCLSIGAKFGIINEYLLLYRVRDNSISSTNLHRAITSTIILQEAYKRKTLITDDFDSFFQRKVKHYRVGSSVVSERFVNKFNVLTNFNRNKTAGNAIKAVGSLLSSRILRILVSNDLKFKATLRKL